MTNIFFVTAFCKANSVGIEFSATQNYVLAESMLGLGEE